MNSQTTSYSKTRCLSWAVSAILLLAISGCAHYRVEIPSDDSTETQGQYEEASMNAYLWGNYMDPLRVVAPCQDDGINDVVIDDNFGYDLISVLTLGIWKPMSVRFRCKAASSSGGTVPFPSN